MKKNTVNEEYLISGLQEVVKYQGNCARTKLRLICKTGCPLYRIEPNRTSDSCVYLTFRDIEETAKTKIEELRKLKWLQKL